MNLLAQFEMEGKIGITIISEPLNVLTDYTWFKNRYETVAIHWCSNHFESPGILFKQGRYSVTVKWKEFSVIACYVSPNVSGGEYSYFLNELDTVIAELEQHYIIIAGDFNAKDKMWGACLTDNRGEKSGTLGGQQRFKAIKCRQ